MDQGVGCENYWATKRVRMAVKTAARASCLLHQQKSRGCIPRLQPKFPKAIEASCRNAGKVQSSGAVAPHSMRAQGEVVIIMNVRIGAALVHGKSGAKQAGGKSLDLGYRDFLAVQRCAFAARRCEKFIINWIVNNACDNRSVLCQRNGSRKARIFVREICCAIQRINVPVKFGTAHVPGTFLGGDGVFRE